MGRWGGGWEGSSIHRPTAECSPLHKPNNKRRLLLTVLRDHYFYGSSPSFYSPACALPRPLTSSHPAANPQISVIHQFVNPKVCYMWLYHLCHWSIQWLRRPLSSVPLPKLKLSNREINYILVYVLYLARPEQDRRQRRSVCHGKWRPRGGRGERHRLYSSWEPWTLQLKNIKIYLQGKATGRL